MLRKFIRPFGQVYTAHQSNGSVSLNRNTALFRPLSINSALRQDFGPPAQPQPSHVSTSQLFTPEDPFIQSVMKKTAKTEIPSAATERIINDVDTVKTTGVIGSRGKEKLARIGVFWGAGDESNAYKEFKNDDSSILSQPLAELEAVILALKQAIYEKKLTRVIVETDSKFVVSCVDRCLPFWKNNDYVKQDGSPVKNRAYWEELDRLVQEIDAKIVHKEHKTRLTNDVFDHLRDEEPLKDRFEQDSDILAPKVTFKSPPPNENTLYVFAKVDEIIRNSRSTYKQAGYGIHCPTKPSLNECGRFAAFPITTFRTQLTGIIKALQVAHRLNFDKVNIVTDSNLFLKFKKWNWKKRDGSPVANAHLYEEIVDLEKGLEVNYIYLPENYNKHMEMAGLLAIEGMVHPVERKAESNVVTKVKKAEDSEPVD